MQRIRINAIYSNDRQGRRRGWLKVLVIDSWSYGTDCSSELGCRAPMAFAATRAGRWRWGRWWLIAL
jgi:hypothetical protein